MDSQSHFTDLALVGLVLKSANAKAFPFSFNGRVGKFSNEELLKLADNYEITTLASLCRIRQC